MTKIRASSTAIYSPHVRPSSPAETAHRADREPAGIISPQYRGFRLACLAAELEAVKRAVDAHWDKLYAEADTPAAKASVLMDERAQRFEPMEWKCDPEIDAVRALDGFIEPYGDGHQTAGDMHRALIELAARALLGAAGVEYLHDPGCKDCPLCRAVALAGRRAHEIDGHEEEVRH